MNDAQIRNLEYMLRGGFEDFPEIKESEDIQLNIENEPKTFLESFTETFDNFSALEINESEEDLINSLDINDELANIQEALDSIREKIMLNENVGELAAIAIPALSMLGAAAVGSIISAKASGNSLIPRPIANLLFDIQQFVTNGKEKERREIIKNSILKNNPKIDPKDINYMIDIAIKNADKFKNVKKPSSGLASKGEHETDFAKINQKRFNLKPAK